MANATEAQRRAWRAEWERSRELQSEFFSADAYLAYQSGIVEGRIRRLAPGARSATERRETNLHVSDEQILGWRREWRSTAQLREEFHSEESYVGFKVGEAHGRIRIKRGR